MKCICELVTKARKTGNKRVVILDADFRIEIYPFQQGEK
jgi:hypothetical protein